MSGILNERCVRYSESYSQPESLSAALRNLSRTTHESVELYVLWISNYS